MIPYPESLCFPNGKMSFCYTKSLLPPRGELKNSQLIFSMGGSKKSHGRPKLQEGKKTKFINVRFTDDEYSQITELEKELGVSKTDLIRMRLLTGSKNIVINSRELIRQLDNAGPEMARIGNNINQLARHANTLKLQDALHPHIVTEFNSLFDEYIQMQQQIETALRKIIRMMGS